jgi:hypothetical protein
MDKDAELLFMQFICEKCNKPIRGCKSMRIKGKRYHMTCGMSIEFGERLRVKE